MFECRYRNQLERNGAGCRTVYTSLTVTAWRNNLGPGKVWEFWEVNLFNVSAFILNF